MFKITKDQIETERSPSEVYKWVFSSLEKFSTPEEKTSLRLLTYPEIKVFVEESYPLAIFCKNYFDVDGSIKIKQKIGEQSYDVEVFGFSNFDYIEVTVAKNGYHEKLRNIELNQKGSVPGHGQIYISGGSKASGTQTVSFESIAVSHEGTKKELKDLILTRVIEKSKIKYPSNTALIVAFEDRYVFYDKDDVDELRMFMEKVLMPIGKDFRTVCLVGLSGKLFLELKTVCEDHTTECSSL